MVVGLTDAIGAVSVHDAIPDDSGSDEITGGSYVRQPVAWSAEALGVSDNNAPVTHEMPSGSTGITYGFWDTSGGSTFYGHALIGSTLSGFAAVDADGVTNNTIKSAGHGLVDGGRVAVYNVHAESLPTGLSEGTLYHVVGAATDTFQVSLTAGGAAVDITAAGELWWQNGVPESFGSAGQLTTDTGDLGLNANVI
jgi:hypothetical protein